MYYLFSKISKYNALEAIHLCDDDEYIENPKLASGVYPMGTLLSYSMKMLKSWIKDTSLLIQYPWSEKGFSETTRSSFSHIASDDQCLQIIFESLLNGYENIISNKTPKEFREILQICMQYISLCQKERKFSSVNHLYSLVNTEKIKLPKQIPYAVKLLSSTISPSNFSIDELKSISSLNGKSFEPTLKINQSKLFPKFPVADPPLPKVTPWGNLISPLTVFPIYDVTDFIFASLHCIFEQKYFLGKCHHCGDLFVDSDSRTKYCPERATEKDIEKDTKKDTKKKTKSCKNLEKAKRQRNKEAKSESEKLHHRNRVTLANKVGTEDQRCRDYMNENLAWHDKIKKKEETEEAYNSWLLEQKEKIKKMPTL